MSGTESFAVSIKIGVLTLSDRKRLARSYPLSFGIMTSRMITSNS